MQHSPIYSILFFACLSFLGTSANCHADIYKWVDANGRTHYSETKTDAGNTKAVEVKVNLDPLSSGPAKSTSTPSWQEQDRLFKQRQAQKAYNQQLGPPSATGPKALSNGRSDDSNASRCNLARDVLSGAVRHGNGKKTDDYDRSVAKNDVQSFCR